MIDVSHYCFVNLDKKDGINMSYCNAHARRKFEPIAKSSKANGIAYTSMMRIA